MEFLRLVEDELRKLSAVARKKYPEVKEAAERATLKLRAMREQYAAAVRQMSGEDTPPLSMFRSQVVLQPFLLVCNHVGAGPKLAGLALGAIQLLMNRDALDPQDLPNVLRVLAIQVKSVESTTELKVLQTTLLVITWRPLELDETCCAEALSICFQLYHSQHATVGNAASATIRQMFSLLFDRVWEEQKLGRGSMTRCAALVFQDLCLLLRDRQSSWLKRVRVTPTLGMELIEQALREHSKVFLEVEGFKDLISGEVAPVLLETLRAEITFPVCARLMRTFSAVMTFYSQEIMSHLEMLLSLLLHTLSGYVQDGVNTPKNGSRGDSSYTGIVDAFGMGMDYNEPNTDDPQLSEPPGLLPNSGSPPPPSWAMILGLEALFSFCSLPEVVLVTFQSHDMGKPPSAPLCRMLCQTLSMMVTAQESMQAVDHVAEVGPALFLAGDHLGNAVPATHPAEETVYAASISLLRFLHSLWELASQMRPSLDEMAVLALTFQGQESENWILLQKLVSVTWESLLNTCSHLLIHSQNILLRSKAIYGYEQLAVLAALTGCCEARNAAVTSLCKLSLPAWHGPELLAEAPTAENSLGWAHVAALRALMRMCHLAGNHLDSCWNVILDCFDQLDTTLMSASSMCVASPVHEPGLFKGESSYDPSLHEDNAQETIPEVKQMIGSNDLIQLHECLDRFPKYTATLETESITAILNALSTLSLNSLAVEATLLPQERKTSFDAPKKTSRGSTKEPFKASPQTYTRKSERAPYPLRCLVQLAMSNVYRLEVVWEVAAGHLRLMARNKAQFLRNFAVEGLTELIIQSLSGLSEDHFPEQKSLPSCLGPPKRQSSSQSGLRLPVTSTFYCFSETVEVPEQSKDTILENMQEELLAGLREFSLTPYLDTREQVLLALNTVLQSCGQLLTKAWGVVFDLLGQVAHSCFQVSQSRHRVMSGDDVGISRTETVTMDQAMSWGGSCLVQAFKSLQLIVDDFLEYVDGPHLPSLVTCMGAFGKQTADVNVAFTAVGMLWSVTDFAAASVAKDSPKPQWIADMWGNMFKELRELSIDKRPEARNCAINTLFSVVVANGRSFDPEEWECYLSKLVFPLLMEIETLTNEASDDADTAVAPEVKKGVKLRMHHSRDTDRKQWNETLVLALQGLGRLLRFCTPLLGGRAWFHRQWQVCLTVGKNAALKGAQRGTNPRISGSTALAGISLLSTMWQMNMKNGVANIGGKKAEAGMQVVDGTLQMVPNDRGPMEEKEHKMDPDYEAVRGDLFLEAWRSFQDGTTFEFDEDGVVTEFVVEILVFIYNRDKSEEFSNPERACELLDLLDSLLNPRSSEDDGGKKKWRPKITIPQRKILSLLKEIKTTNIVVYEKALSILTKRSFQNDGGLTMEFAEEASSALSTLYSAQNIEGDQNAPGQAQAFCSLVKAAAGPFMKQEIQVSTPPNSRVGALQVPTPPNSGVGSLQVSTLPNSRVGGLRPSMPPANSKGGGPNVGVSATRSVQLLTKISGKGLDALHKCEDLDQIIEGWEKLVEALGAFLLFWPTTEDKQKDSPQKADDAEGPDDYSSCCSDLMSILLDRTREELRWEKGKEEKIPSGVKAKIALNFVQTLGRCVLILTETFLLKGWYSPVAGGQYKIIRGCISALLNMFSWFSLSVKVQCRVLYGLLNVIITTCFYLPKLEKFLTISPDSQIATPARITNTQEETITEASHRERLETFTLFILETLNSLHHQDDIHLPSGFVQSIAELVEDLMSRPSSLRSTNESILPRVLEEYEPEEELPLPMNPEGVATSGKKGLHDKGILVILLSPLLCNCLLSPLERVRMLAAILLRNANIAGTVLKLHSEAQHYKSENKALSEQVQKLENDLAGQQPQQVRSWF